jgi:hypothetical protein
MSILPGSAPAQPMAQTATAGDAEAVRRRVAADVAHVLAEEPCASGSDIELALALSLPMARHRVSPIGLVDALRLLRQAILQVAGLDQDREPVPLAAGEPRVAAVAVAVYVAELLGRAASVTGWDRAEVARAAADHLMA